MKPGSIYRDENRGYWKVLDARIIGKDWVKILMARMVRKEVHIKKHGFYCGYKVEWLLSHTGERAFVDSSRIAEWKTVG